MVDRTSATHVVLPRWQKIGYALLAIASLCLLIYSVQLSRSGFSKQSTQIASSERTDCRSATNADFTDIVRRRDALVADGLVAIARNDSATLAALADQVAAANQAVQSLPKLDDAVDHGYTLDGVHHPACPRVG